MNVLAIIIIALLGVTFASIIYAVCQHKYNKELKERLEQKTEAYNGLQKEFELYRQSETFKHEKEKEVNEKIDDLHSGKLSADDILPKR